MIEPRSSTRYMSPLIRPMPTGARSEITTSTVEGSERRSEYRLTEKGEALYPVLVALMQWGDQWSGHEPPMRLVEHDSGKPVEPVGLRVGARSLGLRDVRLEPGPGATAKTIDIVKARNRAILGLD